MCFGKCKDRGKKMTNRILIVAAHPDDEILGCGGTTARLIRERGYEAFTLILGEGITARHEKKDVGKIKNEIKELKKQALEANRILGIRDVFMHDFPDNRFDSIDFLDVVKAVEKVKKDIKPTIVFTHYNGDLNIDHQITYRAVITATRPLFNEMVKEIYSFKVLSSTEWSYPLKFSPNVFFDIGGTLKYKLKAVEMYKSELRKFPHPRSLRGIKLDAEHCGMKVGLRYAEMFELARMIK